MFAETGLGAMPKSAQNGQHKTDQKDVSSGEVGEQGKWQHTQQNENTLDDDEVKNQCGPEKRGCIGQSMLPASGQHERMDYQGWKYRHMGPANGLWQIAQQRHAEHAQMKCQQQPSGPAPERAGPQLQCMEQKNGHADNAEQPGGDG